MKPSLRFKQNEIIKISNRYNYQGNEDVLIALKPDVIHRGYLTLNELQRVAYWKSPRSASHISRNDAYFVEEISGFAFSAGSERARIETLTLLDGVSWPTASVILHLFHREPYPIIDYRALWSLSLDVPPQYKFAFWWLYVEVCRALATTAQVDMRTLDRALWQYSKENQPS